MSTKFLELACGYVSNASLVKLVVRNDDQGVTEILDALRRTVNSWNRCKNEGRMMRFTGRTSGDAYKDQDDLDS